MQGALSGVAFDWLLTCFLQGRFQHSTARNIFSEGTRQQHWSESIESQGSNIFVQKVADHLWPATSFQSSLAGHSKRHRTKDLWRNNGTALGILRARYASNDMRVRFNRHAGQQ